MAEPAAHPVVAPGRRRPHWREWLSHRAGLLGSVFLLWLGTRALYAMITWLADGLHLYSAPASLLGGVAAWQRWDANWYVLISRLGYWTSDAVNFFPLHPMLTGVIAWLLGDGSGPVYPHPDQLRTFVAIAVSNAGLLVGLLAFALLAQSESDSTDGDAGPRAARMMLAFPFAMAWTIGYADGVFVGLVALHPALRPPGSVVSSGDLCIARRALSTCRGDARASPAVGVRRAARLVALAAIT